jgi:hypothetical protein
MRSKQMTALPSSWGWEQNCYDCSPSLAGRLDYGTHGCSRQSASPYLNVRH